MNDEIDLLEVPFFVEPSERAKATISIHGSDRVMSLSKFKADKGHCVWCDCTFRSKGLTDHHMRRWCSDRCAQSAAYLCSPQDPGPKFYRLIFTQHFACAGCGTSYEAEIRALIRREHARWNSHRELFNKAELESNPMEKVRLHYVAYGTGDKWQTDHIIPLHKGGKGIDPSNLQVLCVPCHKLKTVKDLGRI